MTKWNLLIAIFFFTLSACAATDSSATPTSVSQPSQRLAATALPPTATRIPLPSPTPTLTPWPTPGPQIESDASVVATAVPQIEIIAAALNIRQGPGLDYPVVEAVRAGNRFELLGTDPWGDWFQIKTSDGKTGWISAQPQYSRLANRDMSEIAAVVRQQQPASGAGFDGTLIFMTGSGGTLYAIELESGNLRRLADGVIDPVVSPDGRRVAFTRWDGAEFGTVYVINVDGSNERVIATDIRQPKSPTWSPDGRELVISFQQGGQRDPGERCRKFGPGQPVNIPKSNITITSFSTSRSGEINLCYIPFEDLHWHLRRIDINTGKFEDLQSDEYSYNPAWDPQNTWRVIFDGSKGLVQLDLTNGDRWPITEDVRDTGPVFSPDGEMLALTYKQHDHWEVYTLNLESGQRKRLTKPPILANPQYNSASPAWSPDGNRIAFVTDRAGRWEIWVMNVDGSNPQPLFPPEVQAKFNLRYDGVNERMLNWIE